MVENNSYFNSKNLSRQKSINSDILNLKDDFYQIKTTTNSKINLENNKNFFNNNEQKKFLKKKVIIKKNKLLTDKKDSNNTKSINKREEEKKCENKTKKIKKIIKNKIINNNINRNSSDIFNKNKTQQNYFKSKKILDIQKNFTNISDMQSLLNKKNSENKLNKTNTRYFNKLNNSEQISKNKIIYYNSSLNDFYKNNNNIFNINLNSSLRKIDKCKNSLILQKSNSISFISNILNTFKKCEDKKIKKTKKNNKEINKNLLKGFSFLAMNKSVLETLFKKTPIKIKSGILTSLSNEKKNSDIFLTPFTNSYGYLLDDLSEKIGFMKGSINMIYPKVSKVKYHFQDIERNNEFNNYCSEKAKNNFGRKSLENDKTIKNKIKLFNAIKPKIIIQKFLTKYPINIKRKGENEFSSKMYSLKRQQLFRDNDFDLY